MSNITIWEDCAASGLDKFKYCVHGLIKLDNGKSHRVSRNKSSGGFYEKTGKINRDRVEEVIWIEPFKFEDLPEWIEVSKKEIREELEKYEATR